MTAVVQDIKFGARVLLKNPSFSAIAILVIAVGIGANSTIFSFANALLLRPIPGVIEPERLVMIGRTMSGAGFDTLSWPNYVDIRDQNTTLSGLAAFFSTAIHLSTGGEAERVRGAAVTGNYFAVLGVSAELGRTLLEEDSAPPGGSPVVVISDRLWRGHLGADPEIVGQTLVLNAHRYTIVGVAAAPFVGTQIGDPLDVWVPVTMFSQIEPTVWSNADQITSIRNASWLEAFGRLNPNVQPEQVRTELAAIAGRLQEAYPQTNSQVGVTLAAGLGFDPETRSDVSRFFSVMMGVVTLVLLIVCANVANMLLARATARRKEIGIRLAVGASRARIIRQLLTESLLLALLGGAGGLLIAFWANHLLTRFLPPSYMGVPLNFEFTPDLRILGHTLGISMLTGVLFGSLPALQTSRLELVRLLKDSVAVGLNVRSSKLRSALVVSQIALSSVVLICAGLLMRTLYNSRAIDPGFVVDNVLTCRVDVGRQGYSEQQGKDYYGQLLDRVKSLPGVESASFVLTLPLTGGSWGTGVRILGNGLTSEREPISTDYNVVAPHYFDSMRMRLLVGRDFTEHDHSTSSGVVIVNETAARRWWLDANPIGQRLTMGPEQTPLEVVGVVSDIKHRSLFEKPRTLLYLPVNQSYKSTMTLVARTTGRADDLRGAVKSEAKGIDKNLPVFGVRTLEEQVAASLVPQRLAAALVTAFGLIALGLAAIGLYGVMTYIVSQRTREFGVRLALGANPSDLLRMVVLQGAKLILAGLMLGFAAAVPATRLLEALLFGVGAVDPTTFATVAVILAGVALGASLVPARRATRVDPIVALRYE